MSVMNGKPLRLALYGFVEKEAGGLASANLVLVERLAQRGHFIDFHAIDPFVRPTELFAYPNFRYLGVKLPVLELGWPVVNRVPTRAARWAAQMAFSQVTSAAYHRAISRAIVKADRAQPYDALLTLGLLSPFRVGRVPVFSWTQGTPNGEKEGLLSQRQRIKALCGGWMFRSLVNYYRWREMVTRRQLAHSHYVIGGSQWALSSYRQLGLAADRQFALPYPVDLNLYQPAPRPSPAAAGRPVELLHLGRLVPRKRLDLLLEAFQLLRQTEPDVRLRIIGSFAYGRGYERLLHDPRLQPGVTYNSHVPRSEAREALRQADVLVQPSEFENFGTAVAEAQACGLPVVLGPTNGTRDYLDTEEFAFTEYQPASVAAAMARAVHAVRTRGDQLRQSARASAERHFDVDRIVDRLETFLRRASPAGQTPGSPGPLPVPSSTGRS